MKKAAWMEPQDELGSRNAAESGECRCTVDVHHATAHRSDAETAHDPGIEGGLDRRGFFTPSKGAFSDRACGYLRRCLKVRMER